MFKGLKLLHQDKIWLKAAIWRAQDLQCESAQRRGQPPSPIPLVPLPGRGLDYCRFRLSTARLQAWDVTDSFY